MAKTLDDPDLVATALWGRGVDRLYMGLYGTCNKQGIFVVNRTLLEDAVQDFEEAKQNAHPQLQGLAALQSGRAQALLDKNYEPLPTLNKQVNELGEMLKKGKTLQKG